MPGQLEVSQVCLPVVENTPAYSGFDQRFAAGEITVVLGANQSGKTDLCRLIAGLNTRATGETHLDGEMISHVPTQRRDRKSVV